MAALPPDVLFFHILPKLPAKSLVRFMSVSKQWHSFIKTDNSFSDMHLLHVTSNDNRNNHKLLMFSISHKTPREFRAVDCEAPDDGFTPVRHFPFKVSFHTYATSILASCNGLVCVGIQKNWYDKTYSDIVLWNPLTGEYKNLSKANAYGKCLSTKSGRSFALYYVPGDDDYRLLHVTDSYDVIIYSLKSNTWIKIESKKESRYMNLNRLMMVLYNGKIYFLVEIERNIRLMTFDTTTEKFKVITTPHFGNQSAHCSSFTAQRDCICLCIKREGHYNYSDLWRMNEDGDWTKEGINCLLDWALYLMRNGNWLTHDLCHLYIVNLKEHKKHRTSWSLDTKYIRLENGIHVESFVSPNRYTQSCSSIDLVL